MDITQKPFLNKKLTWLILGLVVLLGGSYLFYFSFLEKQLEFEQSLVEKESNFTSLTSKEKRILEEPFFNNFKKGEIDYVSQYQIRAYSDWPAAPRQVEIIDPEVGKTLVISWSFDGVENLEYLRLYRSMRENQLGDKVVDLLVKEGVTSYRDTGLDNNVFYYYTLRSVNFEGKESTNIDQVKAAPTDKTAPSIPQDITIQALPGGIKLKWKNPQEKDFFVTNIYRSSNPEELGELIRQEASEEYLDEKVESNVWYYYTLTALDSSGNESSQKLLELPLGRANPFEPL